MTVKSPFLVYQNFVSPKICDELLSQIEVTAPNRDQDGNPTKMERYCDTAEDIIFTKLQPLIPEIEAHYDFVYRGTEKVVFQYYPEGMKGNCAEPPHAENSQYMRKKWVKTKPVDITGFLWLKDYNDRPPFNQSNEVFGGKTEFAAHNFSLTPQKGTLVLFPAGPHFIKAVSSVLVGNLYQAKINIGAEGIWLYQPQNFPGHFSEWFEQYA